MGCHASKLDNADDSIHVILEHASKKRGDHHGSNHYVPRKEHPLLRNNSSQEQPNIMTTAVESDVDSQNDLDRLLYHAAHHNDTIDSRDMEEYGTSADDDDNKNDSMN